MLQTKIYLNMYNPGGLPRRELLQSFIVRQKEFDYIYDKLTCSTMEHPEQHFIIQGQRGNGKTTLLWKLYYEIKSNSDINERIIPVIFNEEQYNIRTLFHLWERLAEYLEDYKEDSEFLGLSESIEEVFGHTDYEYESYKLLREYLIRNNKKIILFIDNFGDMLNKFSDSEHQRLREVLMTTTDIRIVGASSVILEFTYDYSKPFYEFFEMIYLEGLNKEDTRELLLRLSEVHEVPQLKEMVQKQPERIEALRRLTGGIVRTIIMLIDIFIDNDGDSFRDLEMILDRVTPLYKHRMDDLSNQQQEIIDVIAMNWDAISAKEISQKVRMESKAVSSQLKQLEKHKIIEKIPIDNKNYLYQIQERFFNIWYLMRFGRKKDRQKVKWLVHFLENWCSNEELYSKAEKHIEAMEGGKVYEPYALYMTAALVSTKLPEDIKERLLDSAKRFLKEYDEELLGELCKSDKKLYEEAEKYIKSQQYEEALKKLLQIKDKKDTANAAIFMLYSVTDYPEKAREYYKKLIDAGNKFEKYMEVLMLLRLKTKKLKALELSKDLINAITITNYDAGYVYAILTALLWNDEIDAFTEYIYIYLDNIDCYKKFYEDTLIILMLLIAKKQYYFALKLFNDERYILKERYRPLYFALMHYMKDEYPNEYKKMGSELKETVAEIIKQIDKMAIEYA